MSGLQIRPLAPSHLADATRLLAQACAFDEADRVAEEKLFGDAASGCVAHALGAFQDQALVGLACVSARWIRILAVLPDQRRRGVGSALLQACEDLIASQASCAKIMDQPGNYLSPGIDDRNVETIAWLHRRGFQASGQACNLRIALRANERVSAQRLREHEEAAEAGGYTIAAIAPEQIDAVTAMVEAAFSSTWAFEVRRAATHRPGGVFLALAKDTQTIVAFAAHDGNNQGLGSFGPAGTLDAHRGRGLGAVLLLSCLLDIAAAGHSHAEVAWIGPRDFYDKIAGIESERHFTRMTKTLTPMTPRARNDHD
jgi:GNAT superfamily N-acetyltransferase